MTNVPVWIFHGDKDDVIPVTKSRAMAKSLRALGASVRSTEYSGAGPRCVEQGICRAEVFSVALLSQIESGKEKRLVIRQ